MYFIMYTLSTLAHVTEFYVRCFAKIRVILNVFFSSLLKTRMETLSVAASSKGSSFTCRGMAAEGLINILYLIIHSVSTLVHGTEFYARCFREKRVWSRVNFLSNVESANGAAQWLPLACIQNNMVFKLKFNFEEDHRRNHGHDLSYNAFITFTRAILGLGTSFYFIFTKVNVHFMHFRYRRIDWNEGALSGRSY